MSPMPPLIYRAYNTPRFCTKCRSELMFSEFVLQNNDKFKEAELAHIWLNDVKNKNHNPITFKLYCCTCYKKKMKKNE